MAADPNPVNASCPFGTDFQLTANGSIKFVSGQDRLEERVVRRVFTCPRETLQDGTVVNADYLFDQNYGEGASRAVGELTTPVFLSVMKARIRAGVLVDEGIDSTQEPTISFYSADGYFYASVSVTLLSGDDMTFSFPLSPPGAV